MPITPLTREPLPYVRGGNLGELLQLQGRNAAQAELRRGDIQADMWSRLGQQIQAGLQGYAKERQEAPIRAQEAQARQLAIEQSQGAVKAQKDAEAARTTTQQTNKTIDDLMNSATVADPETGIVTYDRNKLQAGFAQSGIGHLWPQYADLLDKSDASLKTLKETHKAALLDVFRIVDASENDPTVAMNELKRGIKNGLFTEAEAAPYAEAFQRDPTHIGRVTAAALGKKPDLMSVNPGDVVIDKNNPGAGATFTAPPKATEAKKYPVTVAGPDGRPVQKLVTEEELAAGVPAYVAPPQASQDIVQVMGPNGVPVWTRKTDAVGKPAAQAPRAVTGQERQTLAFFNRAKDAVDTITTGQNGADSLEQKIAKMGLASQERLQHAPNWLQTKEGQSYRQAQRAFTEARLRKESGAAIPLAEYENDARTYFAQPGDGPDIVEQKRAARQTVLEGLKFSSGKAYEEYYGEPNVSPARKAQIVVTAPDGSKHEFATQAEADRFKQLAGIP